MEAVEETEEWLKRNRDREIGFQYRLGGFAQALIKGRLAAADFQKEIGHSSMLTSPGASGEVDFGEGSVSESIMSFGQ